MDHIQSASGWSKGVKTLVPTYLEIEDICLYYTNENFRSWPDHFHEQYQIIIAADPKSECEISWRKDSGERKEVILNGQYIIYIEKSVIHSFRTGGAGVFISLGVSEKEMQRLTLGNFWSGVKISQWWKVLKQDTFIWNIVQVIRSLCYLNQRPHLREITSYAQTLISHLLATERNRQPETHSGLTPLQLKKVDIFIEEHFREPLSVNDLAAVAGLKKDHFAHLFKTSTGFSPHQYIIARRLEYVRCLKNLGKFTFAQIAVEAGFYDESHLNYTIKRFCESGLENYRGILPPIAESSNEGAQ